MAVLEHLKENNLSAGVERLASVSVSLQEITMTLQWTAVAFFLYAEIGLNLILCIPFISAKRYGSVTHTMT